MSAENFIAFFKEAMSDEKLREEILSALQGKSKDDAAIAASTIAGRHGVTCTPAVIVEAFDTLEKERRPDSALSDDQLDQVAGGEWFVSARFGDVVRWDWR